MGNEQLRALSLLSVLNLLGLQSDFKTRKGGTEWFGACPICKPKRNKGNFSFDDTGRFHCFSCGEKGRGAIDLVIAVRSCGFQDAVELLQGVAEKASVQVPPTTNRVEQTAPETDSERTENPIYRGTYEKYAVKSHWLEKRGLSPETCKYFGVFEYNNPNRVSKYKGKILIPMLRFKDGELVGYLSRNPLPATDDEPKYLFPPKLAKHLEVFGAFQLKGQVPLRRGYLVESPLCVMRFHQLGFPAVSPYGVSLASEQAEILAQLAKGWIVLPDADRRSECLKSVLPALGQRCWVKAPEFPASDPEHLSKEEILAL